METTVYRLRFKTQLHLGRATGAAQTGSLGLEKTETYISADTLFSAICQTWATFYDNDSLTDFLGRYSDDNQTLPFKLTSAFPYAESVYFFPIPLTCRGNEDTPDDLKKKIKKVQFTSESVFQRIISNETPKHNLINGENLWVSDMDRNLLNISDKEDYDVWKTDTRPRVTIDRQTEESSIWHVQTVQFNTGCGLWFAARYDSDDTKQKVETLLRVLGDNGIGGERNAGYGQFHFCPTHDLEIPTAEDSNRFVTLSPICPKTSDQLAQLLKGDIAYNLNALTGWVGSPGRHKRRKKVNMFAEGSVLNTSDKPVGRLVDLTPKDYSHPVYRYGYAWQVGMKGVSA